MEAIKTTFKGKQVIKLKSGETISLIENCAGRICMDARKQRVVFYRLTRVGVQDAGTGHAGEVIDPATPPDIHFDAVRHAHAARALISASACRQKVLSSASFPKPLQSVDFGTKGNALDSGGHPGGLRSGKSGTTLAGR